MTADLLIALAELAAVGVGVIAILITLKGIREQLWIITFTEYTRRYSEIVKDLPSEARRPGGSFDLDQLSEAERNQVRNAMRGYLNLCSEEFWLHKKRKIDPETWAIWKVGISETVQLPWFRNTWTDTKSEYTFFPEFSAFMEECLAQPLKRSDPS